MEMSSCIPATTIHFSVPGFIKQAQLNLCLSLNFNRGNAIWQQSKVNAITVGNIVIIHRRCRGKKKPTNTAADVVGFQVPLLYLLPSV